MLDFVQKYLCFGNNGKQRSSSSQLSDRRKKVVEGYSCSKCNKSFSAKSLYEIHKTTYCPGIAGLKHPDTLSKNSDSKPKMTTANLYVDTKPNEEGKERKKPSEKSPKSRSQVYRHDGDKSMNMSQSISTLKTTPSQSPMEKKRGGIEHIIVTQPEGEKADQVETSIQSITSLTTDPIEKLANEFMNMPLAERQPLELKFIEENINKKSLVKYVVSEIWINRYTDYLNGTSKSLPGPIQNQDTKRKIMTKPLSQNIYTVNDTVWKFMYKLYGGGPEILQNNRTTSISASDSDKYSEPRTADTMSRSEATESLRTSVSSSLKSSTKKTSFYLKPVGMKNESFYCYMNSCLQGILAISELAHYAHEEKYKEATHAKNYKFWKAMNEVVTAHTKRGYHCLPKAVRRASASIFDADEQHDAHEFFRFLLSGMQDEVNLSRPKKEVEITDPDMSWAYYRKYNVSIVDELFAGQLVNRVTCGACDHVSTTFDPFLDLSLPIAPGKTKNIDECLELFQKEEEIKDSYVCEKCKSKSRAVKRLVVNRFPKYLVIHLKRFQTYPKKRKLIDQINFPIENWNVRKVYEKETNSYSLIGNIVHRGSFDSGHYICYSKRGGEWILCDDEATRAVSAKEVASKEAYVLIYERKN